MVTQVASRMLKIKKREGVVSTAKHFFITTNVVHFALQMSCDEQCNKFAMNDQI